MALYLFNDSFISATDHSFKFPKWSRGSHCKTKDIRSQCIQQQISVILKGCLWRLDFRKHIWEKKRLNIQKMQQKQFRKLKIHLILNLTKYFCWLNGYQINHVNRLPKTCNTSQNCTGTVQNCLITRLWLHTSFPMTVFIKPIKTE